MHKAELRKLLCAMLIGDGSVQCNQNGSHWFSLHHSMKQAEWLLWKKHQIDAFFRKKGVVRKYYLKFDTPQRNKNGKTYYSCKYHLYWPKYFRIFRKWVYRADRTKRMSFLLRHIDTDKHLFIWFMDDGSEESNVNTHIDGSTYRTNPRLILHICDFTEEDAKLAVEWFKKNYDVEPRIIYTSKAQGRKPRLRFLAKDVRNKLFPRIRVYVNQLEVAKKKFSFCLERY